MISSSSGNGEPHLNIHSFPVTWKWRGIILMREKKLKPKKKSKNLELIAQICYCVWARYYKNLHMRQIKDSRRPYWLQSFFYGKKISSLFGLFRLFYEVRPRLLRRMSRLLRVLPATIIFYSRNKWLFLLDYRWFEATHSDPSDQTPSWRISWLRYCDLMKFVRWK